MGGRSDKLYARQNQVHASAHCLFKLLQKLTVLSATPRRSPPRSNRHFKKQHTRFKRAVSLFSIELSTARHTPSTLVIRPKAHDSTSHSFYSLSNNQQVYEPNSSYHKTPNVFFCHSTLILTTLNTSVYAFDIVDHINSTEFLNMWKIVQCCSLTLFYFSHLNVVCVCAPYWLTVPLNVCRKQQGLGLISHH